MVFIDSKHLKTIWIYVQASKLPVFMKTSEIFKLKVLVEKSPLIRNRTSIAIELKLMTLIYSLNLTLSILTIRLRIWYNTNLANLRLVYVSRFYPKCKYETCIRRKIWFPTIFVFMKFFSKMTFWARFCRFATLFEQFSKIEFIRNLKCSPFKQYPELSIF